MSYSVQVEFEIVEEITIRSWLGEIVVTALLGKPTEKGQKTISEYGKVYQIYILKSDENHLVCHGFDSQDEAVQSIKDDLEKVGYRELLIIRRLEATPLKIIEGEMQLELRPGANRRRKEEMSRRERDIRDYIVPYK